MMFVVEMVANGVAWVWYVYMAVSSEQMGEGRNLFRVARWVIVKDI
jgi:hypothetical protein